MLTLPFRLAFTVFIALFCASGLVRRAVAGIAVSAAIVAVQHEQSFSSFASAAAEDGTLKALLLFMGG